MPASEDEHEPALEEVQAEEAVPEVLVVEEAIDPVTAVLCSSPPEPEAKKALENLQPTLAMASSVEWLADSVLAIYSRPLLGVEAANAAVAQFALDNLSACVVTGIFKLDRIGRRPARNWADWPVAEGLPLQHVGGLPVGQAATGFRNGSLCARFSAVRSRRGARRHRANEGRARTRARAGSSPTAQSGRTPGHFGSAQASGGVCRTRAVGAARPRAAPWRLSKPKKPSSFNWNNIISLLLLIGFGTAAYFLLPLLQSNT